MPAAGERSGAKGRAMQTAHSAGDEEVAVSSIQNLETVTKPLRVNLLFIITMHQLF